MGQVIFASSVLIVVAVLFGLSAQPGPRPIASDVAFAAPEIGAPQQLTVGDTASALSTAAFGLSALHPETYNGQIARDVIAASPLGYSEKDRLTAKLYAADAGRAYLPKVLLDVRTSLAVE